MYLFRMWFCDSVLAAAVTVSSKGDIILRTFIGLVFIMSLMCLAAVITGKIGQLSGKYTGETTNGLSDGEEITGESAGQSGKTEDPSEEDQF